MLIMRLLELYIAALDSYISSMNTPLEGTVRDRFFGPLKNAADTAAHSRKCHGLSDWEYLQSGVGRCLEIVHSGRDWGTARGQVNNNELRVDNGRSWGDGRFWAAEVPPWRYLSKAGVDAQ